MKKIITLSDIHYPTNIDLTPIIKFIKDEQPDEIIYLGDIVNADGISRFWEGDIESGVYQTVEEIKGFVKEIHSKIRVVAPKAKITLTGGNHLEARVRKAIKKKNYRKNLLDLKKYLPDVNILEYGKIYKVGKLGYSHGWYYNEYYTKKTLLNIGINMIVAHTHNVQEYTKQSPVDSQPMMAKGIGCLCNINPDYRYNQPNSWVHAFHIAYIQPNGLFYEYTIKIVKGHFHFNNKTY